MQTKRCLKCGELIPSDSDFCQYCGEPSSQDSADANIQPKEMKDTRYCKKCGGKIDYSTKKCLGCGKQYFQTKRHLLILCLSSAIVALAGLNMLQFFRRTPQIETTKELDEKATKKEDDPRIDELTKKNDDLKTDITKLEDSLSQKENSISELKGMVEKNEKKAEFYDDICKALRTGTLGYASDNFCASECVVIMSKRQNKTQFSIEAHWETGGLVSIEQSSSGAARASIDEESWDTTATVTVEAIHAGVTTLRFTNDVDSLFFNVVVVVTEQ